MKKSNPMDVVFKDKTKCDVQNPAVGSLIVQVQENKKKQREYLKQLSGASSVTDIDIGKRLKELKDFNEGWNGSDDHDDDDEPCVPPTPQPSLSRTSEDIFSTPRCTPAVGDGDNCTSTQRFPLDRPSTGRERVAGTTGQELTATIPRPVAFSDNVTSVFPTAWKIDVNNDIRRDYLYNTTNSDILEIKPAIGKLTLGKEPKQLRFYSRGEKEALQLIATAIQRVGALSE